MTEISINSEDHPDDMLLKFLAMDDNQFQLAQEELQEASEQIGTMMDAWCKAQWYRNGEKGN